MPPTPTPPTLKPRRILGTSLKLYFDLASTIQYAKSLSTLSALAAQNNIDLFLIPDFVSLYPVSQTLNPNVLLGAQDCFWQDSGAFTGEVSPKTLQQLGVNIVEIGHAERRRLFHETDAEVAKKAAAVCRNNMIPLVCVGEKSHHAIASAAVGMAVQEVKPQVMAVIDAVPEDAEVVIAYEPVWAIGASEPAGADHVVAVTKLIRDMVGQRKGSVRVVYGGSAGPGTFEGLKEGVDGLFLGRFAHDVGNLEKVIKEMST